MLVFRKIHDLKEHLDHLRSQGKTVGFVPTMGALHNGHLALVALAKQERSVVVASVFVNPAQFDNASDLDLYPRSEGNDVDVLEGAGCDFLFLPAVEEMYPGGAGQEHYDLGALEHILEGAHRPGHFQGVAKVVDLLLSIVRPDTIYMGQKDYQQCAIVERLIALKGHSTELHKAPTIREADGLAMSSRNKRLTEAQRSRAGLVYQCLVSVQAKKNLQSFSVVRKECEGILAHKGFQSDYIELADASTLEPLENYDLNREMVCLIAVRLGDIRLIDNLVL